MSKFYVIYLFDTILQFYKTEDSVMQDPYYNIKELKLRWNYKGYDEFIAGLSEKRKKADKEYLSKIFNAAAKTDQGKKALDWANSHGIKFIIDRTTKSGGYYREGMTGVVAIASNKSLAYSVEVLVHEVTHAWQDTQGFITTNKGQNFNEHYMKIALVEADAFARGCLAHRQYSISKDLENESKIDENAALWNEFKSFYSDWRGRAYGAIYSGVYIDILDIKWQYKKDFRHEYEPYKNGGTPYSEGIDITSQEFVRRLGNKFGGGNYFPKESRDFIQKIALSSSQAFNFYSEMSSIWDKKSPALDKQSSDVRAIRKKQLQLKLGRI